MIYVEVFIDGRKTVTYKTTSEDQVKKIVDREKAKLKKDGTKNGRVFVDRDSK